MAYFMFARHGTIPSYIARLSSYEVTLLALFIEKLTTNEKALMDKNAR